MWWIISVFLTITGVIALLRYLTLSQNNGYVLPKSKSFFRFYIATSLCVSVIYILSVLAILVEEKIIYAATILSILYAISLSIKFFSYRIKFKFTSRGRKNFIFSLFSLIFALSIIAIFVKKPNIFALAICPVLLGEPLIIGIVLTLSNIHYDRKNTRFINEQKERLKSISPLVVGITGSYGKTSCKNILKNLLSDDFNVHCTDKNFNTPMGVALSVEKLPSDAEIFIAEFGARKTGDINELCTLFPPNYGIITGVCEQHTETFGSIEDICREKFVLAQSVSDNGGTCVFNGNDKNVLRMWKDYKGKKIVASSFKKGDVYAVDISLGASGSKFNLVVDGKAYPCRTSLLGRHNVQNVVMCVALALELGCKVEKLVEKIENLPQTPHRLEYTFANGVYILDDGYNGNIVGVKSSLEVLASFPGRHIVVSQGIVELGRKAAEINETVGRELSEVADVVILCGVNSKFIEKGLKNRNFQGRIIMAKNMKNVKKCIGETVKIGDTILLQNDVPDIY